MKKNLSSLIAIVSATLIFSLALTGCPNDKKSEQKPQQEIQEAPVQEEVKVEEKVEEPKPEKTEEPKVVVVEEPHSTVSLDQVDWSRTEIMLMENADKGNSYNPTGDNGFITGPAQFYVIGWSKDGKFAYRLDRYSDGRGSTYTNYYIVDTVTDKVVYQVGFDNEDGNYDSVKKNFDAKLNENKIFISFGKYYNQLKGECPADPDGNPIKFVITGKDAGDDENGFHLVDFTCTAKTKGKEKVLTSQKKFQAYDVFVSGSVMSPFESRCAVIISNTTRGFEGMDVDCMIAGCNTKVRFE